MMETTQIQARDLKYKMRVLIPSSEYVLTVRSVSFYKCHPPKVSVSFLEIDVPVQIPENELVQVLVEADGINKDLIKRLMQRSLDSQQSAPSPQLAAYWAGRAEALEFVLCLLDADYLPEGRDKLIQSFTNGETL